jgi:hypothetical protein
MVYFEIEKKTLAKRPLALLNTLNNIRKKHYFSAFVDKVLT